jgi:hypothetical protein
MNLLDHIAEARIQEAIDRGELRGLPGEGKPLRLEDDSAIPEELRAAYRLLKNAGFLPPELQLRRDVREAEHLLQQLPESDRSRARARLELLQLRLAASRRQPMNLLLEDRYRQRLLERLD